MIHLEGAGGQRDCRQSLQSSRARAARLPGAVAALPPCLISGSGLPGRPWGSAMQRAAPILRPLLPRRDGVSDSAMPCWRRPCAMPSRRAGSIPKRRRRSAGSAGRAVEPAVVILTGRWRGNCFYPGVDTRTVVLPDTPEQGGGWRYGRHCPSLLELVSLFADSGSLAPR
jgi:hypothetical protein